MNRLQLGFEEPDNNELLGCLGTLFAKKILTHKKPKHRIKLSLNLKEAATRNQRKTINSKNLNKGGGWKEIESKVRAGCSKPEWTCKQSQEHYQSEDRIDLPCLRILDSYKYQYKGNEKREKVWKKYEQE